MYNGYVTTCYCDRLVNMSQLKYGRLLQIPCVLCPRPVQIFSRRTLSQKSNTRCDSAVNYLRGLKWVPIPLGVGFAYIGYQQFEHIKKREEYNINKAKNPEDILASDWQVYLYTALPLRVTSRVFGYVNELEIPISMRSSIYKYYINKFHCNMEEAVIQNLKEYKNLGELFKRRLSNGCRPIDQNHSVTSPSDGRVLHFGKINKGLVEQVKGVTYSLQGFLGPVTGKQPGNNIANKTEHISPKQYKKSLKYKRGTNLYHCVIYLAPGDYHGFHSPMEWTLLHRRHFPGELLSVNPGIANWIKGLFTLNERAVYFGEWEQGFCSLAAVGATNVGSINVYCDEELETNTADKFTPGSYHDKTFLLPDTAGISVEKGEPFGEFHLGSTIVLIFEAPKSFQFKIEAGQTIKIGQPVGCCQ